MTGLGGDFLGWLGTTTLSGTVLAAAIGGLKALLGPKMPLNLHHGVWLILVVRLLVPVLPQVPLGLPSPGTDHLGPLAARTSPSPDPGSAAPSSPPSTGPTLRIGPETFDATPWLLGLWAAGFLWSLGRMVASDRGLRRQVAQTAQRPPEWVVRVYRTCYADLGIPGTIPLVVTSAVRSPSLHGWPRSRILLPEDLLDSLIPEELSHVLSHELAHASRHDLLWGWVTGVLGCLHWFNPVLHLAFRQMDRDAEAACDAVALAATGAGGRTGYGQTLVRLSTLLSGRPHPRGTAGWTAPHRNLARRLQLILDPPRTSRRSRGLSLGLVFLVALGGLTTAQAPLPDPAPASPRGSGLVITVEDRRTPRTKYLLSPTEYLKRSLFGLVSGGGRSLTVNGRPLGPGVLEGLPSTGPWVLSAVGDPAELLESLQMVHEDPAHEAGLRVTRTVGDQISRPGEAPDPAGLLSLFAPFQDKGGPSPFIGAEMTVQDLNAEKPRRGEAPTLWFSRLDEARLAVPFPVTLPALLPEGYRLVPKIPVNHRKDGSWIVQLSFTPSGRWEANGITVFESNQVYLADSSRWMVPVTVDGETGKLWAFMGSWTNPENSGMTAYLAHQLSWSHQGRLYAVVDGTAQTKAVLTAIASSVP